MTTARTCFAIVGCGAIAEVHARAIDALGDEAELIAVVDPEGDKAQRFAESWRTRWTTSYDDVLADPGVGAVAICAPSGLHAELAVPALEAGKDVVIEKPLDVTVEAARRVVDAAATAGRTAAVISQHRFDPASELARDAVHNGRLGAVTSAVASVAWWRSTDYFTAARWRGTRELDGGGALLNQGVHWLDLMLWLLGDVVEVSARSARLVHDEIDVEDTLVATLAFADGALGAFHATTAAYPGVNVRLQIHGSAGSVVIVDDALEYLHLREDGDPPAPVYGLGPAGNQLATQSGAAGHTSGPAPSAMGDAHIAQYRDFLDAVRTGREPRCNAADGMRTLSVAEAIYESAASGGGPVVPCRP